MFSRNRKIMLCLQSLLFHQQNWVLIFWRFYLELRFFGKYSLSPWNQTNFLMKSDKDLSPSKINKKKIKTWYCRQKTAEVGNVKINVSLNLPCTFSSSKLVLSFKFSYREKRVLNFALLHKWNVNNSIEKVKVYFSILFYGED